MHMTMIQFKRYGSETETDVCVGGNFMQLLAFVGYVTSSVMVLVTIVRGKLKWAVVFLGFTIMFSIAFVHSVLI